MNTSTDEPIDPAEFGNEPAPDLDQAEPIAVLEPGADQWTAINAMIRRYVPTSRHQTQLSEQP